MDREEALVCSAEERDLLLEVHESESVSHMMCNFVLGGCCVWCEDFMGAVEGEEVE